MLKFLPPRLARLRVAAPGLILLLSAGPCHAQSLPGECAGIPATPGADELAARFDRNLNCLRLLSQLADITHKQSDIARARADIFKAEHPEKSPSPSATASMMPANAMFPNAMMPPSPPPQSRAEPETKPHPAPALALPQVEAIAGGIGGNHAYLRMADGSSVVATPGTRLSGNIVIRKITDEDVIATTPEGEKALPSVADADTGTATSTPAAPQGMPGFPRWGGTP
ncbi:type IV pilus biogenesis protein PilP [Asaia bogorensis]|uniref:Type IV pilus biogenesis protein PilP n=1 Tax=Asaia bogorensis NBRC 16594 TaxID=1231624 RepID=A0AAN4R5L7_9PROT|nr:type IV pilus biogenesis protein PilP [Asaia bogorensis]GBQ81494.1 hypothetical protein AA0311_2631 [Asaia bogorensis NBRC 16594]GEL54848.1 hypothetical protein ABO01nite_28550 [Asaia bogorensis NBRC 16594]